MLFSFRSITNIDLFKIYFRKVCCLFDQLFNCQSSRRQLRSCSFRLFACCLLFPKNVNIFVGPGNRSCSVNMGILHHLSLLCQHFFKTFFIFSNFFIFFFSLSPQLSLVFTILITISIKKMTTSVIL